MKQELKQQFIDALYEVYPDCQAHGTVTRKQIDDVMQKKGIIKYPSWLTYSHARVERGVFSIAAALGTAPRANPAPVAKPTSTVVHIHSHQSANEDSLIPQLDPNYVPFGNYKDTEAIIKSKMFYPVYITGPSGNGKSAMIEQLCAKHKRPMIRVNLTAMADEEMLIGSKTLVNGNIEVIDGPVIKAMRMGAILLLDELDCGNPNAILAIQGVLEKGRYYFKLKDEIVIAAPGFNVFATANTKGRGNEDGRYIGTNFLNEAFLERFAITMNQDYPSASVEKKILMNVMESHDCIDETFADDLVKWSDSIRRTFEDGGIDEIITTRRLIHIVRTYSIFKDKKKAVTLGCNRFDPATVGAFIDLFEKINAPTNDESSADSNSENNPF